jgi:HrpA-like RNA helicase
LKIPKTDVIYDSINRFNPASASLDEQVVRATALLIVHLIEVQNAFKEDTGEKKTILVFMPGLYEIMMLSDMILFEGEKAKDLILIQLHSSLGDDDQERAFSDPPPNKRKVIIATNIAESSITIADVYFVIDLCLTKEIHYDPVNKNENLQLSWASKASCRQRSGRAGRVRDGFVFRMVPKDFYDYKLLNYPKPEMQR